MRPFERVRLREDPSQRGTVYATKPNTREAFVVWDGGYGMAHHLSELDPIDGGQNLAARRWLRESNTCERQSNPPLIYAPEIADLQFVTRIDPETDTVYMERDDNYRGRGAEFPLIESSEDIYRFFERMSELDREHIVVGLLNIRNELTGWKIIHVGELASVEASARQIIRDSMLANAAGIFVLHNHPTGDPQPSDADKELTDFLAKRAEMDDIFFFDHVIIGVEADHHEPYYSFRDDGFLNNNEGE